MQKVQSSIPGIQITEFQEQEWGTPLPETWKAIKVGATI